MSYQYQDTDTTFSNPDQFKTAFYFGPLAGYETSEQQNLNGAPGPKEKPPGEVKQAFEKETGMDISHHQS